MKLIHVHPVVNREVNEPQVVVDLTNSASSENLVAIDLRSGDDIILRFIWGD